MIKVSYMMKDNTLRVYVLLVCMLLFFISSTMEAVLCAQHLNSRQCIPMGKIKYVLS